MAPLPVAPWVFLVGLTVSCVLMWGAGVETPQAAPHDKWHSEQGLPHDTMTATGVTNYITSITQITPATKVLSPTTTTPASQIITQSTDTTTTGQDTTTLDGDTTTAMTDSTAAAVGETTSAIGTTTVSAYTTMEGTEITAPMTSPTDIVVSIYSGTDTATDTVTTTEVVKTTTAAPGGNILGTTLLVINITSALPNATTASNATVNTVPESDVTNPDEYTYGTEDYVSASESENEYGPELAEDSTAIPESNTTGAVTPSTPGATGSI